MDTNQQDDHNPPKIEIVEVSFEVVHPGGPDDEIASNFENVKEWLLNICDNENPEITIDSFEFGLVGRGEQFFVYLVGTNTHEKVKNHFATSIEFEPRDIYFLLPESEYANLSYAEASESLTRQLKDFTNTKAFQMSFLTTANSIKFNGLEIWPK